MEVKAARVNWQEGWNSDPRLEVLVDKIPDHAELRYEYKEGMYFAEADGYVAFLFHSGVPEQQDGFCGRHHKLTMQDGTEVTLKGPWSSRAGVANLLGFTPSADVSLTDDEGAWERGYTFFAAHITEEMFRQAVSRFCPDVVVDRKDRHGEMTPFLRRVEDPCAVCKGSGEHKPLYGRSDSPVPCRWCGGTGHETDHEAVLSRFADTVKKEARRKLE